MNRGKDKILMFRLLSEAEEKGAAKLALQTSHEWEYARETEGTATKDGTVQSSGALEVKLSIEAISTADEVNKMLLNSVIKDEALEVWEIDYAHKVEGGENAGKYPAKYAQGKLNKWTVPDDVEDNETLSTEMAINFAPKDGFVTLTASQEKEIDYAFRDIDVYVPEP